MNFLKLLNTEGGRFLLGTLGQKPTHPIVYATKNSFVERLDKNVYQATLFSKAPLLTLFSPIMEKIRIARQEKEIDVYKAFLHYSNLEKTYNTFPQIFLLTKTLNPAAGAAAPFDGFTNNGGGEETWANKRDGNGDFATVSDATATVWYIDTGSTSNLFANLHRGYFGFDTGGLHAGLFQSGTFSLYVTAKTSGFNIGTGVYKATVASPSTLANSDFEGTVNNTALQSDTTVNIGSYTTSQYTDFVLNAEGIATLNKTGYTFYGTKLVADATNTPPTWAGSTTGSVTVNMADNGTNIPKLVVVYILKSSIAGYFDV